MSKQQLVERLKADEAGLQLKEAKGVPGVLAWVDCKISKCNEKNKNDRVYEIPLWDRVLGLEDIQEGLKGRTLLGEPDHPETRTDSCIREASHFLEGMHLDPYDNWLKGRMGLLDVPYGRTIHTMLQAGVKLGLSTRGDGDLVEDDESGSTRVDPETYEFKGVDFVLNPSFAEAGPMSESYKKKIRKSLMESVETGKADAEVIKSVEQLTGVKIKDEKPTEKPVEEKPKEESTKEAIDINKFEAAFDAFIQKYYHMASVEDAGKILDYLNSWVAREIEGLTQEGYDVAFGSEITGRGGRAGTESAEKKPDVSLTALEKILAELRDANFKVGDFEEKLKESETKFQSITQENAELKKKIEELEKQVVGTATVTKLKQMLREIQTKQKEIVAKYHQEKQAREQTEKKLTRSVEVIEELRKQLLQEQKEVEEQEKKVEKEKLDSYKKAKLDGIELSESLKKLLEGTKSEEDVDQIVKGLRESRVRNYPGLPNLPDLATREEIVNAALKNEDEAKRDPETDDTEQLVESQIR